MAALDGQIDHALMMLPPPLPSPLGPPPNFCDAMYHSPTHPADYVVRTNPGEYADFSVKLAGKLNPDIMRYSCNNYTHVHPFRGSAAFKAGDVGSPEAIVFRKGSAVPYELQIKRVGDEEWTKFLPRKDGVLNEQKNLSVYAQQPPEKHMIKYDDMWRTTTAAHKQYGLEAMKGFLESKIS